MLLKFLALGWITIRNIYGYRNEKMYNIAMEREQVIHILRQNQVEISGFGVTALTLFGSVARGESGINSDVDLLVEFNRPTGLFGLISLKKRLEELLGCPVDIGTRDSLKASIRSRVLEDCIDVT